MGVDLKTLNDEWLNSMEERILIVDDEERICGHLAQRLTQEGYSCKTAKNIHEALSQFPGSAFSLILVDIEMPEMNGLEFLKKIKAMDAGMLVVMLTKVSRIEMALEAVRLGAYDFIIDPSNSELVALSVKRALEKKRLEEELETHRTNLENLVGERTSRLQEAYGVLKKTRLDSVKVLVEAIDAKDPYTCGHSDRVSKLSVEIATHLGFTEDQLEILEYGALLHDIGKIGIKDGILQKPGRLSPKEYQHIQEHPLIGVKIVEGVEFFRDKISVIRNHHERFDGSGYPDGLVGEDIPLRARIVSIADAFDAMTSLRPHRRAMSLEDALMEMGRGRGTQFDPHFLEIFLEEKIFESLKAQGAK